MNIYKQIHASPNLKPSTQIVREMNEDEKNKVVFRCDILNYVSIKLGEVIGMGLLAHTHDEIISRSRAAIIPITIYSC